MHFVQETIRLGISNCKHSLNQVPKPRSLRHLEQNEKVIWINRLINNEKKASTYFWVFMRLLRLIRLLQFIEIIDSFHLKPNSVSSCCCQISKSSWIKSWKHAAFTVPIYRIEADLHGKLHQFEFEKIPNFWYWYPKCQSGHKKQEIFSRKIKRTKCR